MGVPQAGKQIVTDYIRNGWCFAAAKIERAEGGLSTPHPIRFDFKVAQAVYPMRLTALAPSSPALELYLVGDGTASTRMLQREFSDAYAEVKENTFDDVVEGKPSSEEAGGTSRLFSGARYGEDIGHPDLLDVLWDKCVVTKLSGRLTSVQMKEDLSFSWTGLTPTRRHLFSYRGAAVMAVSIVTDLILLFVAVTALSLKSRITRPDGTLWYCFGVLWYYRKRFLVGIGLACVLGASFYLMVPKVEVQLGTRGRPLSRVAENIAYGLPMTANSVEGASKIVEERLLYWQRTRNEFTGEPIMREASPGNYDVREKDGRLCFVYYDRAGTEHWQRMTWSGMSK
jgi:hypothetical protein